MEAKQVARAGLMVALLAVAAWVTVPFGPIPFTLQTLALAMMPAMLDRSTAIAAIVAYVLLGALGLPVFSSFMGGIGVLAGPTGGFLWGFVLGIIAATTLDHTLKEKITAPFARALVADFVMLVISYACGTVQLMMVGSMDLMPALMVAVVPFIIPDAIKLAVGARLGCAVSRAQVRLTR